MGDHVHEQLHHPRGRDDQEPHGSRHHEALCRERCEGDHVHEQLHLHLHSAQEAHGGQDHELKEAEAEVWNEKVVPLAECEAAKDPLRHARIRRVIGNTMYTGHVECIEVGEVSRERLYHIRYCDGDHEHFTQEQVKEMEDTTSSTRVLPCMYLK